MATNELRTDVFDRLHRRVQRLRELRDMTQHRDERVRLDAELDRIQITLSDLENMDDPAMRNVIERERRRTARVRGRGAEPMRSPLRTLGHGVLAGLGGTAVMTVAQIIEMKLQDRPPSTAPAEALEKMLNVQLRDEAQKQRVTNGLHFAYGTAWGTVRAALAALGLRGATADLVHLGVVWGTALRMLPALDLAPPVREWGKKAIAQDLLLHAIYAFATGAMYRALEQRAQSTSDSAAIPPPREELEPEPRAVRPGEYPGPGLVTAYPDRSEWEAEVSDRARRAIHEGKRSKRTKGPTTEAS